MGTRNELDLLPNDLVDVDSSEWDSLPNDLVDVMPSEWESASYEPQKSFVDSTKDYLAAGYQGLENFGRNVETSGLIGLELLGNSLGTDFNSIRDVRRQRQKEKLLATRELVDPNDTSANLVSGVVEGAAPSVLTYLATRSPQLASAAPAFMSSLDKYAEARDKGTDYWTGIAAGGTRGAVDYIGNRVSLNTSLKGADSYLGGLARSAIEGFGGGVISESGNVLSDIITGERPTLEEAKDRILEAGKYSAIAGPATHTVMTGARSLGRLTPYTLRTDFDSERQRIGELMDDYESKKNPPPPPAPPPKQLPPGSEPLLMLPPGNDPIYQPPQRVVDASRPPTDLPSGDAPIVPEWNMNQPILSEKSNLTLDSDVALDVKTKYSLPAPSSPSQEVAWQNRYDEPQASRIINPEETNYNENVTLVRPENLDVSGFDPNLRLVKTKPTKSNRPLITPDENLGLRNSKIYEPGESEPSEILRQKKNLTDTEQSIVDEVIQTNKARQLSEKQKNKALQNDVQSLEKERQIALSKIITDDRSRIDETPQGDGYPSLPVDKGNTYVIDPLALKLSDEVPQFKKVIKPIQDKFEFENQTNAVAVWRRLDGSLEVISGRHRLNAAQRDVLNSIKNGEDVSRKKLDIKIFDESNGFDVNQARLFDVVSNIKDGFATAKDIAYFLDANPQAREQYTRQGVMNGRIDSATNLPTNLQGRQGYDIAVKGESNLKALFYNNKLNAKEAAIIAAAAPNDSLFQGIGIDAVLKNKMSPDGVETYINILKKSPELLSRIQNANNEDAQGTLFNDVVSQRAIQEAKGLSDTAVELQQQVKAELALAANVDRKKQYADKIGIDIRDEAALKKHVESLRENYYKLKNFLSFPEVAAQVKDAYRAKYFNAAENNAKSQSFELNQKNSEFDSPIVSNVEERPLTTNQIKPVSSSDGKIYVEVGQPEVEIANKDIDRAQGLMAEHDKLTESMSNSSVFERKSNSNKKRKGQLGAVGLFNFRSSADNITDARTPDTREYVGSGVYKSWQRLTERMRTTTEKYPQIKPWFETKTIDIPNAQNGALISMMDSFAPYANLSEGEKQKLKPFLIEQRKRIADGRQKTKYTFDDIKALGFDDKLAKAAIAYEGTMDKALSYAKAAALNEIANNPDFDFAKKQKLINKTNDYFNGLRDKGYTPLGRAGDYVGYIPGDSGDPLFYTMGRSESEVKQKIANWRRTQSEVNPRVANRTAKLMTSKSANLPFHYQKLPGDISGMLSRIVGDVSPKGDVRDNFLKAKLIEGFDNSAEDVDYKYLAGISRLYAESKYSHVTKNTLKELESKGNYGLFNRVYEFEKNLKNPKYYSAFLQKNVKPFMNLFQLSGNVANLTLNALETTDMPIHAQRYLSQHFGINDASVAAKLATKSMADYAGGKTGLKTEYKNLFEYGKKIGYLDNKVLGQVWDALDYERNPLSSSIYELNQFIGSPNAKTEDIVKKYAYTLGYNVAKEGGLSGEAAYRFAQDFTNDVKSTGARVEQNKLAQDFPMFEMWQNYAHNRYRLLNRAGRENRAGALLATAALATTLGGVWAALPLGKQIQAVLEQEGYDPKGNIKSIVGEGKLNDFIASGVPGAFFNTDTSRTAGYGNMSIGTVQGDLLTNVGQFALGAYATIPSRISRGYQSFKMGDYPKATEALSPMFTAQIVKGQNLRKYGKSDSSGNLIISPNDVTTGDIVRQSINFPSLKVSKKQEFNNSLLVNSEKASDAKKELKSHMKQAFKEKDLPRIRRLLQEPLAVELLSESRNVKDILSAAKGKSSVITRIMQLPVKQRLDAFKEYIRQFGKDAAIEELNIEAGN